MFRLEQALPLEVARKNKSRKRIILSQRSGDGSDCRGGRHGACLMQAFMEHRFLFLSHVTFCGRSQSPLRFRVTCMKYELVPWAYSKDACLYGWTPPLTLHIYSFTHGNSPFATKVIQLYQSVPQIPVIAYVAPVFSLYR